MSAVAVAARPRVPRRAADPRSCGGHNSVIHRARSRFTVTPEAQFRVLRGSGSRLAGRGECRSNCPRLPGEEIEHCAGASATPRLGAGKTNSPESVNRPWNRKRRRKDFPRGSIESRGPPSSSRTSVIIRSVRFVLVQFRGKQASSVSVSSRKVTSTFYSGKFGTVLLGNASFQRCSCVVEQSFHIIDIYSDCWMFLVFGV